MLTSGHGIAVAHINSAAMPTRLRPAQHQANQHPTAYRKGP